MLSTSELILNYICPSLGVIVSGIMFSGTFLLTVFHHPVVSFLSYIRVTVLTSLSSDSRSQGGDPQGKTRRTESNTMGDSNWKLSWLVCLCVLYA